MCVYWNEFALLFFARSLFTQLKTGNALHGGCISAIPGSRVHVNLFANKYCNNNVFATINRLQNAEKQRHYLNIATLYLGCSLENERTRCNWFFDFSISDNLPGIDSSAGSFNQMQISEWVLIDTLSSLLWRFSFKMLRIEVCNFVQTQNVPLITDFVLRWISHWKKIQKALLYSTRLLHCRQKWDMRRIEVNESRDEANATFALQNEQCNFVTYVIRPKWIWNSDSEYK